MILPNPPPTYVQSAEFDRNRTLELEDKSNRKTGQDIELGDERLILRSPDGTRWSLAVDDAGVITATGL